MGTVVERLQLVIDAVDKGARSTIAGVGDETEKASLKTRLLEGAQSKLGLSSAEMASGLKVAGVAAAGMAATGLAAWAAKGVEEFTDLASKVRDFERVTGASAEESSRWVAAADDMEVSSETLSRGAFKLSREIGQNKNALAEWGIQAATNKDGSLNLTETMLNVADAYKNSSDQGERAAMIQAAFGKAGKELIPILEQGRKGIKEFFQGAEEGHQILSEADVRMAREYELAMDDLGDTVRGLQMEVGKAVIPTLTEQMNNASEGMELADKGAGLLGSSLGDLGHTALNTINPFSAATNAVGVLGDAFGIGGDDAKDFGDKQKAVKDATTNLANAISEHGEKSKEARDAQRELSAASKDLKGDQDQVAGALQNVNDKLQTETEKLYATVTAARAASGDHLNLDNAVAGVTQKLYDLATAQGAGTESTFQLQGRQRDLAAQVLAVTDAAAKQAVDNLGPNASAQAKMKAATDAQTGALQYLYAQFPGLREAVQGYVGDLGTVPPSKDTTINVDIWQAQANLEALEATINRITSGVHTVTIAVVGGAKELAGG